ncbi:hypothetical protein AAVH_02223 [Aphelenchoides avenae]|nr:hypothetical protein AAVH_02223 [Aphelenchus avenae]
MLPAHVFTDIVGFMHFYDLDALLLTNARCSQLAQAATVQIRVFDFSEFHFTLTEDKITAENLTLYIPYGSVSIPCDEDGTATPKLRFNDTAELVQFIPYALRNCVLHSMTLTTGVTRLPARVVAQAIKEVAHTITIGDSLTVEARGFATLEHLVNFAASFRRHVTVEGVFAANERAQLSVLFRKRGFVHPAANSYRFRVSYNATPQVFR